MTRKITLFCLPSVMFLASRAAGALRMPIAKFLLWAWIGKTIKMLLFAYAGATSMGWMMCLFGGIP